MWRRAARGHTGLFDELVGLAFMEAPQATFVMILASLHRHPQL